MEQKQIPTAIRVMSIISPIISGLGLLAGSMIIVMFIFSGTGQSTTAITNEFVLGFVGGLFFVGISIILGAIGTLYGIIVTIIDIVKKCFRILWMPILGTVMGFVPLIIPIILLIVISL